MKSTLKDVVLICKGWYNKEKYPTIFDALKEYYKQYYCADVDFEDKWLNTLLKVVLQQAMRELAEKYPDRLFKFVSDDLFFDDNAYICLKYPMQEYEEVLFCRIVNFFNWLKMRGDGITEIDTDDYFCKRQDEDTGKIEKELLEEIIK